MADPLLFQMLNIWPVDQSGQIVLTRMVPGYA